MIASLAVHFAPCARSVVALLCLATLTAPACNREHTPALGEVVENMRIKVIARHPHDPGAFTQGLEWYRGKLYESTGLHGHSTVRRVNMESGEVESQAALPDDYFGEGLTRVAGQLVQLSWQKEKAVVWDLATLKTVMEYEYQGEGWGLCFDGKSFLMSNGTDTLQRRDRKDFALRGEVKVTKNGQPVSHLNELECVDGVVYANIWQTEIIARIDPGTGKVTGWIDAAGLLAPSERRGTDVLNGIAYIPEKDVFAVTGKNWPALFEVQFEAIDASGP